MSADTACTLRAPPRFLAPGLEYNGVLQTPPQPRSPLLELGAARQTDWDAAAVGSTTARRGSVGRQLASAHLETSDTVNPNQLGHALIASLAARWLLGRAACAPPGAVSCF